MDQIRDNERTLRDIVQRHDYYDISVIDIFTAFNVLVSKPIDSSSITDDKYFQLLLGAVSHVPRGREREYWFDSMFRIFEKLSNTDASSPNWLLLQANLIYLAPVSEHAEVIARFQSNY